MPTEEPSSWAASMGPRVSQLLPPAMPLAFHVRCTESFSTALSQDVLPGPRRSDSAAAPPCSSGRLILVSGFQRLPHSNSLRLSSSAEPQGREKEGLSGPPSQGPANCIAEPEQLTSVFRLTVTIYCCVCVDFPKTSLPQGWTTFSTSERTASNFSQLLLILFSKTTGCNSARDAIKC